MDDNYLINLFDLSGQVAAVVGNPQQEPLILACIATSRWDVLDDLKEVVLFLASAASDYVQGAIISMDGGYLGR